jgi:hypothetical protein
MLVQPRSFQSQTIIFHHPDMCVNLSYFFVVIALAPGAILLQAQARVLEAVPERVVSCAKALAGGHLFYRRLCLTRFTG